MKNTYERVDLASERRVQAMIDRARFEDLYDTAVDVFLSKPPEITEPKVYSQEELVVAACGVRGLAVALDCKRREQVFTDAAEDEDGGFYISTDSVVRYPQAFSTPVDLDIQQKIENLGSGLLDEAYLVLGTEVKPMVERYRAATTPQEQVAVLEWLNKLCIHIGDAERRDATGDDDDYIYHPARLSPKLIGQFPHNALTPTCLGFGIIVESFLKKAGAIQLQGGVANTHYDSLRKYYFSEATETYHMARAGGFNSIEASSLEAAEWGAFDYTNIGFHAATYTRLMDGSWYCVDPNYRLGYQLDEFDTGLLQNAYKDLIEISGIAKGIEIPVSFGHRSVSVVISETLDLVRPFQLDFSTIRPLLVSDDAESLAFRVFSEIAKQVAGIQQQTEDTSVKSLLRVMENIDTEIINEDVHAFGYWQEFIAGWDKHVLHGLDVETMVSRCKQDPHFLRRRLEDVQLLPVVALQGMLAREMDNFKNKITDNKNKHDFVEVGLPEYRTGCAVLSDLAVYTHALLSPQFFLSYWPGHVPITETAGTAGLDRVRTLENNMEWLDHTDFYYPQQCGIIKKHFSGKQADSEE